ncbi:MAG: crotonase/enoyl-CoA hydratase family protein [Caulobacterales bacterium]|nr:crotonase/enoyl-CoA hydratase family protein [Caulobacterales bacterium]
MSEQLEYRFDDGVATITMNDSKANVMSTRMLSDLGAAFDKAQRDQAIVVLRSSLKGIFSAGFDLKVFATNDPERSLEMVKAGAELALRLLTFPFPTIGVMEGDAFPMGAFLLLACDVRVAARGPSRIGLNEVAIGISPPGFAIELARSRVQPAWLSRTVTLGEMFGPDEAAVAGFLDRVVPPSAVDETVNEIVSALRTLHGPSHTLAKRRLRHPTEVAMRKVIDRELTLDAYVASSAARTAVARPGASR